MIDRFTHLTLHFADALTGESRATLQDMMDIYRSVAPLGMIAHHGRVCTGGGGPLRRNVSGGPAPFAGVPSVPIPPPFPCARSYDMMESHVGLLVTPGVRRPLSGIRVTDFMGSVATAHLLSQARAW